MIILTILIQVWLIITLLSYSYKTEYHCDSYHWWYYTKEFHPEILIPWLFIVTALTPYIYFLVETFIKFTSLN
jgi:hypothetical protein